MALVCLKLYVRRHVEYGPAEFVKLDDTDVYVHASVFMLEFKFKRFWKANVMLSLRVDVDF